jgi:hypothetical protein
LGAASKKRHRGRRAEADGGDLSPEIRLDGCEVKRKTGEGVLRSWYSGDMGDL